jgi:NADH dehydrogenase
MRVLVLGGTGFLGRHVVAALAARDHVVLIGTRRPARQTAHDDDAPLQRLTRFEWLTEPARWEPLLEGVDAVVNCVGILREFGAATYERVHLVAPAALAAACRAARVRRLIHVSALGLRRDARSRFVLSKLRGEIALSRSGMPCTIVRPSLLEGNGGYGSDWLRRMASWPVHCIPHEAVGRIAVVDVRDVADAIAVLCVRATPRRVETVELGGRSAFTLGEYLAMLRQLDGQRRATTVRISPQAARIIARLCDLARVTPFTLGHLELLRRDNLPAMNNLPRLLERPLHGLGSALVTPSGWDTVRHAAWRVG